MPTDDEIQAGFDEARKAINETGFGHWVDDSKLIDVVMRVLKAAEVARNGKP